MVFFCLCRYHNKVTIDREGLIVCTNKSTQSVYSLRVYSSSPVYLWIYMNSVQLKVKRFLLINLWQYYGLLFTTIDNMFFTYLYILRIIRESFMIIYNYNLLMTIYYNSNLIIIIGFRVRIGSFFMFVFTLKGVQ